MRLIFINFKEAVDRKLIKLKCPNCNKYCKIVKEFGTYFAVCSKCIYVKEL